MKKIQDTLKKIHPALTLGVAGFIVLAVSTVCLGYYNIRNSARIESLSLDVSTLKMDLASSSQIFDDKVAKYRSDLAAGIMETKQNVGAIQSQLGNYKEQVGNITGTVTTLQKLSKTDPQLLQKYSKVFFLNENYAPAELTEVTDDYRYGTAKHPIVSTPVWSHLKQMMDDAKASNAKILVSSAYRSFNEQSALKGVYKVTYGAGTANSFSADQGYSEHQLGTAVDFTTTGLKGALDGFDSTEAYDWLMTNAYKYGFVISYPKNNPYYIFEPWHWRYVGVKLATNLHTTHQNFYDLDQRTIDGYLVNLFD